MLLKQDADLLNYTSQTIPSQNSAANTLERDVVGQKTDTTSGNSIYSLAYGAYKSQINNGKVYPTLAAGVTATANATPWVLGTIVEIVPVSTITAGPFNIIGIVLEEISAQAVYEIVLYQGPGGSETEIGRTRIARLSTPAADPEEFIHTLLVPANKRISMAIACGTGGSTITASLKYLLF